MNDDSVYRQIEWQPSLRLEDLWGPEMAGRLVEALDDRMREERERSEYLQRIRDQASKGRAEEVSEELKRLIADAPQESAPVSPPAAGLRLATVSVPRSCAIGFGPYNTWAQTGDEPVRAATADEAPPSDTLPSGHLLHPRIVALEGGYSLTVGSGCWFQVAQSGPHLLVAHFAHNSHNLLSGAFGYAEGSITFLGSVWGASEGRWVDRGGFSQVVSREHYFSLARFENADTLISGQFDAIAGGAYYCAGRISIEAGAWGLLSVANVESNATMDFLQVCTQP